jgi:hypothetical protein
MANQQRGINQSQKPVEGYRGALVYRQEYEYTLITLMIDLLTPDERSSVSSHADDFDIPVEAEHLHTGSPLAAVDLYHFPVTDGKEIELTIRNRAGEHKTRYPVAANGVEEHSSFLWLNVLKARDGLGAHDSTSREPGYDVR